VTDTTFAADPVTFEVIRGALVSTAEEMKSVIMRAAFSPLLSLSADLSCAILDAAGEVVAQGNDIPVHLGAMPFTGRGVLAAVPAAEWRPGDAVLTNDPYLGGTHLPDMTLMSPIFADGALLGFAASRVHWPDVGGIAAGSSSVTDEILKEGLRVPPVFVAREGSIDERILGLLLANMRVPHDRLGDFKAQWAGNRRGVARVEDLAARYGGGTVRRVFAETQDRAEAAVRAALAALPDGEFRYAEALDGDGYEDAGARDFTIAATVTKRGPTIRFDFAGTAPACRGPMNAPLAVTASAVYYVVMCLAEGATPPNSGAYRPVEIAALPGSLVNALPPSPVVSANTETSSRIVDVLLGALAQADPARITAGSYGSATVYTLGGRDAGRGGRAFVHYETVGGGGGAGRGHPGLGGLRVHMGNTMNLPVEAMEAAMPIRFERYELIEGSGGAGRWPGGEGVRKSFRALRDGIEFSILSERGIVPAQGLAGGGPGRRARFRHVPAGGGAVALPSKVGRLRLGAGDLVEIETPGGGGWGEEG
jgi:N-methylhydantoinase B